MSRLQYILPFDSKSIFIGLWVLLIVLFIKFIAKKFQKDPRFVKLAKTLPGPPTLPLLGNSLNLCYGDDMIKRMVEFHEKYGDLYRLWIGKHLVIAFSAVEDLEVIFMNSKMLGKPEIFYPFKEFWGNGLFASPMHIWKKNRKRFQPMFSNNRMATYVGDFNDKIYHLVDVLKKLIDEPEFEAWDYLPHTAFDIISKTSLNVELAWDDESISEFHKDSGRALQISYNRVRQPLLHNQFISDLLYKKEMDRIRGNAVKFSKQIVADKLKEISDQMKKTPDREIPLKNFLAAAYEMKEETNDEILMHDAIIDIISGGTNTVATMLGFLLLAVAIHQDVQDKVYDEIHEVFGDSDRVADQDDVKRLPYLDQVFKETLRRFTLLPLILRGVEEDSKIGDLWIPAGSIVLVSIAAVHFNPKYYPNPWAFNPENFNPEVAQMRPKFAYIPFSAGARNCVGQNYAILELKLALIALLRNFSFHTTMKMEDIKMDMGFVMFSMNGYKLSVKSRTKKPSYLKNEE